MKVRITARICSWIVRRALLDPRCQEFVINEITDSHDVEQMMERVAEEAVRDHERNEAHISDTDVDDSIESAIRNIDARDLDHIDRAIRDEMDDTVEDTVDRFIMGLKGQDAQYMAAELAMREVV